MVVHCILSIPVGDEIVPGEDSAEDQVVDDLLTAEHHSGGKYWISMPFFRVITSGRLLGCIS